jgi:hypothetical protein
MKFLSSAAIDGLGFIRFYDDQLCLKSVSPWHEENRSTRLCRLSTPKCLGFLSTHIPAFREMSNGVSSELFR